MSGASTDQAEIAALHAECERLRSALRTSEERQLHLFDRNPLSGDEVVQDGRTFWVNTSNPGTLIVATPSLPGEPEGHVLVQVPDTVGWDLDAVLTFLGSVRVGPDAQAGVG